MEYLGYSDRNIQNFVDWSQVSKNFADTLDKLESDRQKKREDILNQNDEVQDALSNAPMSRNDSFQELIGDGTNQMKEQQFVLFNMMKSGKMDYNEYLRQTNNLKQGMNDLVSLSAEFDKQYDAKMAAWQKGEIRYKNVYDMVNDVEIFRDFTNGSLYVDNANSRLYFAKRNQDGSINKQQLSSVANMKFELDKMEKVWKGDDTFVKDVSNKMAKSRIVDTKGRLLYIEGGIDQLGEKALRDDIRALLVNPEHVADYLTRNMTGYEFTRDPEAAKRNPKLILEMGSDEDIAGYSSKISEEQLQLVEDDIYQRILSKVPRRETVKPITRTRPTRQPTETDIRIATDGKYLRYLVEGSKAQKEEAVQHFQGKSKDMSITLTPRGGVIVEKNVGGDRKVYPEVYSDDPATMEKALATNVTGVSFDRLRISPGNVVTTAENVVVPVGVVGEDLADIKITTDNYEKYPLSDFINDATFRTDKKGNESVVNTVLDNIVLSPSQRNQAKVYHSDDDSIIIEIGGQVYKSAPLEYTVIMDPTRGIAAKNAEKITQLVQRIQLGQPFNVDNFLKGKRK